MINTFLDYRRLLVVRYQRWIYTELLAYGKGFYPRLFKRVREIPKLELLESEEDKLQKLMVWTSITVKQDLPQFFEKVGVKPTSKTKHKYVIFVYQS